MVKPNIFGEEAAEADCYSARMRKWQSAPSICKAGNDLFCCFSGDNFGGDEQPNNYNVIMRSTDNGETWKTVCVIDHMDSVNNPGFLYVRQQLDTIDKSVDVIHLEGNHDLDEVNTSADIRRQEYYAYIGANNVDVVTDFGNEFRNYGYKDFENKRIRVIYLNTSDVAEEGMTTHLRISPEQFTWFINTALNFSGKTSASDWQVIVLTHIPLNYTNTAISNLLQVLQDYKGKKSGSITQNGTTINYNFTNCQQTFLCHIQRNQLCYVIIIIY